MSRPGNNVRESLGAGVEHASRLAALDREADRELAVRTKRVAFVYVPVILLLTLITELKDVAPGASALVGTLYLGTGLVRLWMSRSFDSAYDASPSRWRARFALVTLAPAAVWGALLPLIGLQLGFGWTFLVCLLATAGVAAGSISSLSPRLRILRAFVSLALLPTIVMLAIAGRGREVL